MRQGLPTATPPSGRSRTTTLPAPPTVSGTDRDARPHDDPTTQPPARADGNRPREPGTCGTGSRGERMGRGEQLDAGAELGPGTDHDRRRIEKDAVQVHERSIADRDLGAP